MPPGAEAGRYIYGHAPKRKLLSPGFLTMSARGSLPAPESGAGADKLPLALYVGITGLNKTTLRQEARIIGWADPSYPGRLVRPVGWINELEVQKIRPATPAGSSRR